MFELRRIDTILHESLGENRGHECPEGNTVGVTCLQELFYRISQGTEEDFSALMFISMFMSSSGGALAMIALYCAGVMPGSF